MTKFSVLNILVDDGFALAQQGKASAALNMSIYASVLGALISGVVLITVAPSVAQFALKIGPPEYFMLALFGLTLIAGVSGDSLNKGIVMALFGLLISTIGMDPQDGINRFTFGQNYLLSGLDILPIIIGLFAIAQVFNQIESGTKSISTKGYKKERFGLKNILPYRMTILKSGIIGTIIGAIPGTGASISSFTSYVEARRTSKEPEKFGKGSLEAIAASEAGNNGTTGSTLIPMMTLGIPGDVTTAILIGALMMHGLAPGPELFVKNPNLVYTIMFGFLVINIIMLIQAKLAVGLFARISIIPSSVLMPVILILCLVGAFSVGNAMYTVGIALIFGVLGYVVPKYGYPIVPLAIAVILGPLAETSLKQSLQLSNGSMDIFFTRPISAILFVLCVLSCLLPTIQKRMRMRRDHKISQAHEEKC